MINTVQIEGTFPRDPDAKLSEGGTAFWVGTIANKAVRWDKEAKQDMPVTNWIRLIAFGEVADRLTGEGLVQGDGILVTGSLGTLEREVKGVKETKTQVEVKDYSVTRRSRYRSGPSPVQHTVQDDPWGAPGR